MVTKGVSKRLVLTFEQSGYNTTRHWEMTAQEQHCFVKQKKGMPFDLSLIKKLRLVHAAEAGHTKLALGVIGQRARAEQNNCRVVQVPFFEHPQPTQDVGNVAPGGLG